MTKAKSIAVAVAVVFGIGVLTIGSCAALLYTGFQRTNSTVSPKIDAMFSAIASGDFADTYDTETSTEYRGAATKEQHVAIGDAIRVRLGKLRSKSLQSFNLKQQNADTFIDATYSATFDKGQGTIVVRLKREDEAWKFVNFRVNSPVFERDLAAKKCAACGGVHAAGARFCPSCGEAVSPASAPDDEPQPDGQPSDSPEGGVQE